MTRSDAWQGQYLRLTTKPAEALRPDPRLATLWLPINNAPDAPVPNTADCIVESAEEARRAISLLTGASDIEGMQLLTDRQGWLRALNARGAGAWSDDDLLCRSPEASSAAAGALSGNAVSASPRGDALGRILRAMDVEPVRYVKGGRVH